MIQKFPIIKNLSPPHRSIAITLGLLILYELVKNIPLPFLFPNNHFSRLGPEFDLAPRFNFFSIGIWPALIGFFLVEAFSFVLPPLKNYRVEGKKGRNKLTKVSLIVSLLLAVWMAYPRVLTYGTMITPDGQPLFGDTSLFHQGLLGFVLVLGFVALCGLAELITRHGIGNGFTIMLAYGLIAYIPVRIYNLFTQDSNVVPLEIGRKNIMTGEPPNLVAILLFIFLLMVLYKKFWSGVPFTELCKKFWHSIPVVFKNLGPVVLKARAGGKSIDFQLPYLPQGIFFLIWGLTTFTYTLAFPFRLISAESLTVLYLHNTWSYLLLDTIILFGLSYLGYWLISHPDRIIHNTLGKITFQDGWRKKVDVNAIRVIIIVTLAWFLWHIPDVIMEQGNIIYEVIGLGEVIILVAIIKDVMDQYFFLKKAENPRVLATFDNVHYVTVMKGLFEAEGIRFCVQAFEYRRLFYFFEPLIKMRVLVDARDFDKANQLADLENVTLI